MSSIVIRETLDHAMHSCELFPRYVVPHFRRQLESKRRSRDRVATTPGAKVSHVAVEKAFSDAGIAPSDEAERVAVEGRGRTR